MRLTAIISLIAPDDLRSIRIATKSVNVSSEPMWIPCTANRCMSTIARR
jgi:hypothetical protein